MYIQWTGDTAVMVAVREGKTGVVKELMVSGANLNLQDKVCQYYSNTVFMNPQALTSVLATLRHYSPWPLGS